MPSGISWPPPWDLVMGPSPLIATALHAGGDVRPGLGRFMALGEGPRHAARDALSARWAGLFLNQVIVNRSRFEIDLDQPREQAIPLEALDGDGQPVWSEPPAREVYEETLALYDRFYDDVAGYLRVAESRFRDVLLLDLRCDRTTSEAAVWLSTPTPDCPHCEHAISMLSATLRDAVQHLAPVTRPRGRLGGVFLPWASMRFGPGVHAVSLRVVVPASHEGDLSAALGRAVELALLSSIPHLDTGIRGRLLRRAAGR